MYVLNRKVVMACSFQMIFELVAVHPVISRGGIFSRLSSVCTDDDEIMKRFTLPVDYQVLRPFEVQLPPTNPEIALETLVLPQRHHWVHLLPWSDLTSPTETGSCSLLLDHHSPLDVAL